MQFSDLELNYKSYLPSNKDSRILDVGCGNGRVLKFLRSQGYSNVLGVDVDGEALKSVPPEIKTELISDLETFLRAHDNEYDLVIAKDVLYYLQPKQVVPHLELMRKSMKPNGKIIAEVFNGAILTSRYTQHKDFGIQFSFTDHTLQNSLVTAGFRVTALFAQRLPKSRLRSFAYMALQKLWERALNLIYILERGRDDQNPRLFSKSIIAVGECID